jgi:hypothetical protein
MSELDDRIREALAAEDADLFGEDESLGDMVAASFQGRQRWVVILTWGSLAVFFVLCLLALWQLFAAETTRGQVLWAVGVTYTLIMIMGMKVWYWMHLNRNSVLREVKRVELQLARLAARLPGPEA